MRPALKFAMALTATLTGVVPRAHATLGDRLVLAVNGVPYSQRQVEVYILVKESLRKTADGNVRLVVPGNWSDAITVFADDMVVLQESQRLGSFQAPDQALGKYLTVVRDKIAKGVALRAALARLGVDDTALGRALEEVLRVAAFRRSKDRQDAQAKEQGAAPPRRVGPPKWLAELTARAVVRRYEGADVYQVIEPTQGSAGGDRTP